MSKERVEVDVRFVRGTDTAILVVDADDNQVWLLLSQLEIPEETYPSEAQINRVSSYCGDQFKLSIPQWLAIEKGLV